MNLLLNTESLRPPLTGIGNYTLNLLREFSAGSSIDQIGCFNGASWISAEQQLIAVAIECDSEDQKVISEKSTLLSSVRNMVRSVPGAYKLHSHLVNRRFAQTPVNSMNTIYHEPNFILKDFSGPAITTVHDLSFMHYPQYHPKERVNWLTSQLPKTLKRADYVLADSNVVRHELIERFNVAEDRVKTIYLGADERFMPRTDDQISDVLSRMGLVYKSYVLYVGTIEPRKGVDVLLDAWCALPKELRKAYPLVIAGSSGWGNKGLLDRIRSLHEQGSICYLKYVPDNILPALYAGASVFCYPSVYEGFGLPVLEAMSCGTPVICRSGTSMAEFAQAGCILCDTGEISELTEKLLLTLGSEGQQQLYAKLSLDISAQFSWARCAKETADIYRLVSTNN
jgi:glycosyltransferase involved in cell wall biosynthesis